MSSELIGSVFHRITFPPSRAFFVQCFDVPGVGVFSRVKSAGFVKGFGGSFLMFHLSPVTVFLFYNHTQKFFVYVTPPPRIYSVVCFHGLTVFFFRFRLYYFLILSHRYLARRRCVDSIHPRGMLSPVGRRRLSRRYRDSRNHSHRRRFRLPRFPCLFRFFGLALFSTFR